MLNEKLNCEDLILNIEQIDKNFTIEKIINNWKKIEVLSGECDIIKPVEVYLEIKKFSDEIELTGKVKTRLRMECSKCLEEVILDIQNDINCTYIFEKEEYFNKKTEHLNVLDNLVYYNSNIINLTERVIEAIILSIPETPLCNENCKGLCTICGKNLNEDNSHYCEKDYVDPRFEELLKLIEKQEK